MAAQVSKVVGFAVVKPPDARVSVSKVVGFAVVWIPLSSVAVSKVVGYAAIVEGEPAPSSARPVLMVAT